MGWLTDLFGQGPRYVTIASSGAHATGDTAGPDTKSADIACMGQKWKLIDDVLEGHDAIKKGGECFLPKFEKESLAKYKRRQEIELGPNTVLFAPPSDGTGGSKWEILGPDAALVEQIGKSPERVLDVFSKLAMEPTIPKAGVTATAAGVDNSRAHSAIEAWAGKLKNGLDEGLAYTAAMAQHRRHGHRDVSTDFAALTGSTDEAKIIGDAQKRNVISARTERAELKRRGILGPDFNEDLAEEQQGLQPEQPFDPVSGNVLAFDQVAS